MNQFFHLFIISLISSYSLGQVNKSDYLIKEANLTITLPNLSWNLTDNQKDETILYTFKRDPIVDRDSNNIIPAIMIYVDEARSYKNDLIMYSIWKQKPFIEKGVKIDKILTWQDSDYPLSFKNSIIYKCHYTSNSIDHIFYMIHLLNKQKMGVQIYMDMTNSISDICEKEFVSVIKSIRIK